MASRRAASLALLIACMTALAGCGGSGSDRPAVIAGGGAPTANDGELEVFLSDAPPTYDSLREVNLAIRRVEVVGVASTGSATFTSFSTPLFDARPGAERVIDVLPLRAGRRELLASGPVKGDVFYKVRLHVARAEVLVGSTIQRTLSTDNGGLALAGGTQAQDVRIYEVDGPVSGVLVPRGETRRVLIDLDLEESLEAIGDPSEPSGIVLTPVMRLRELADGTLRGTVRDSGGAPLANAEVTLFEGGLGGSNTTTVVGVTRTDRDGVYVLEGVDSAQHVLFIERDGFSTFRQEVTVNGTQTIDAQLAPQTPN
jgi:hypothetical protein